MKYATVVNCMDGRVQRPVYDYVQKLFSVDVVDTITSPGPVAALAMGTAHRDMAHIDACLQVSLNSHDSTQCAVIAHDFCAGNQVSDDQQKSELKQAVENLRLRYSGFTEIVGLFLELSSGKITRII
jgi:carbonic anhydrase